jgi:molybdopterin synthase sulfur carrier subunit
MKIQVRYFAALREALSTLGSLRDALAARSARHAEVLRRGRAVRCALDQRLCAEETLLAEGAEVAFFPPVTGG